MLLQSSVLIGLGYVLLLCVEYNVVFDTTTTTTSLLLLLLLLLQLC